MKVEYDEHKRIEIWRARELDLARAGEVFDQYHLTRWDEAHSEDEERFISVGLYDDRVVIVVWTLRGDTRRIITMWKANDKEQAGYASRRADASGDEA